MGGLTINSWFGQIWTGNETQCSAVKDIQVSKAFYEKLGFLVFMGDISQNWLILKNGHHMIGLFQGMFEKNILTFNPGWDQSARQLATFIDVRELQRQLKAQGVALQSEAVLRLDQLLP